MECEVAAVVVFEESYFAILLGIFDNPVIKMYDASVYPDTLGRCYPFMRTDDCECEKNYGMVLKEYPSLSSHSMLRGRAVHNLWALRRESWKVMMLPGRA